MLLPLEPLTLSAFIAQPFQNMQAARNVCTLKSSEMLAFERNALECLPPLPSLISNKKSNLHSSDHRTLTHVLKL